MPTDSIRNIERAFTGRVPVISLDNESPINQIFELINFRDIFNSLKPAGAINPTLSIAIENLQLISYLPGIFRPHKLPDYDEDLIPLLKKQAEDLQWMSEFNPSTQYALEITLFESFYINNEWGRWSALARKWLYNQQTEYYLDLINPFLSKKQSDIGGDNYRLGVAITQKPTQQTAFANNNYLRFRCSYSGILSYEQNPTPKNLNRNSGSQNATINASVQVLIYRQKRKILYFQNTGKSIIYYNFGEPFATSENALFLLPNESLSYEGDKVNKSLPLAEYLINEPLYIFTEGKNEKGESVNINKISFIEFYED